MTKPRPTKASTAASMALGTALLLVCHTIVASAAGQDMAKIAAADQADRTSGTNKIDWDVVGKRDDARRAQVMQLLDSGQMRTAEDFSNAALVFQHGDSVRDTQLALALATVASRMDPSSRDARQLMADAWDRIMVRSGKPQWYGTQFVRSKTTGKWELYPIDPNVVSEAQRSAMGIPTLEEDKAHLAEINK